MFIQRLLFAAVYLLSLNTMVTAQNSQPEPVEISLDTIWGLNMPGIRELETSDDHRLAKLIGAIRRKLSDKPPQGQTAKACFAVTGAGPDALREAHSVLVDGKKPRQELPSGRDVSLVFFSHEFGRYVQLQRVLRDRNDIEIQYQFVPHKSLELTVHFALIPLGKMIPGKVQVHIKQLPMDDEFRRSGWKSVEPEVAKRVICQSFSFSVE
jgi:hypothetical protein